MMAQTHSVGFVYVLTNRGMPGLVKIGFTESLPEDRAKKLYTTGVPTGFEVAFRAATSRPRDLETRIHKNLEKHRFDEAREFFQVDVHQAIEAVRFALIDIAGIGSWKNKKPHLLVEDDRLSLALKEGQIFALICFADTAQLISGRAEILDLWQVHSEGDILEISAAHTSSQVAGFSDDDPGSSEDPVPYLNRDQTATNGMITGRERLVSGDRLLWIAAPDDEECSAYAISEARTPCQIVSRTWHPSVTADGIPLLLNHFTYEAVWPEASIAMREAVALPTPRVWAPHSDCSATSAINNEPPPPEYWLPQLKARLSKSHIKKGTDLFLRK